MISFVVAMDRNRAIGLHNKLPWHLPADLNYFKRTTMGHPIIMGRKTFESIGKPLPGRENVVLTRNTEYHAEGCVVLHTAEEAKARYFDREAFVIGGADIFSQFLPLADRLYITLIDHEFEADTFFSPIDEKQWRIVSEEPGVTNEKNPYSYAFRVYERISHT